MMPQASSASTLGAVVLAAGGSLRLGQPKQLVSFKGTTLIERAVTSVLAVPEIWPVVVVLGAHAAAIRPRAARHPVLIVENPAWAEGMASSLRVGLTTLLQFSRRLDAALFALCDQPAFSPAVVAELLAVHRTAPHAVTAAHYAGRLGAPAIIPRAHFGFLASLTGDQGARQLFAALPPEALRSVALPGLARDLDTPADLAELDR